MQLHRPLATFPLRCFFFILFFLHNSLHTPFVALIEPLELGVLSPNVSSISSFQISQCQPSKLTRRFSIGQLTCRSDYTLLIMCGFLWLFKHDTLRNEWFRTLDTGVSCSYSVQGLDSLVGILWGQLVGRAKVMYDSKR